ncbi:UDP-N-acetylmuramoyl-L-alanine--D-glutamate ligase [Halomonas vilamensis]|uniref:UDP-N-acetylmuramoylalanine--D-glutamate ligase n=1 Tax=Vreelandella vilamensis TaxID=531309 RepID=A0ABU1H177_9GAMM|nr:UDP-N-acetylmuramoyl-L-alanine--D-glutamate ligase [Halomonas vilamensis]MDR5898065.1 UDP-N-acetylmuramoyl-L-alanine--D-glutamate ligase [Halomonas vilamensis]
MIAVPEGTTVVVGLGVSGRAICRHLARLGVPFAIADTRAEPPGLDEVKRAYPDVAIYCGPLTALDLSQVEEVVVSPGVDPRAPGLGALADEINPHTGEPRVVGEMALFVRAAKAPIAAITGSNAKSTVTTLLGEMALASGVNAAVGGNLGTPALDLLAQMPDATLYILELSSFQLETTPILGAKCAAFLNLCEDHLDRHGDMATYRAAKQRVFIAAEHAVVNGDDPHTWPDVSHRVGHVTPFTRHAPEKDSPDDNTWGLGESDGEPCLLHGATPWLPVRELGMAGQHNQLNALTALAMGQVLGFEHKAMCDVLRRFKGLKHRSEVVATVEGVRWVNDSKGTNVGATLAAIEGIGPTLSGKLILLAGGDGKGADFTPLAAPLAAHARQALLFGRDALRLDAALKAYVETHHYADLTQAMEAAAQLAMPGDCVLLSPACASLDQFPNYQRRGDVFCHWVAEHALSVKERS